MVVFVSVGRLLRKLGLDVVRYMLGCVVRNFVVVVVLFVDVLWWKLI